ncbi:glycosyltransferase family 4 protein [Vaginisenegalia massiliensis]|uniref:glycosyltransferase family 4 protein n=1 Tax=Vaginisenegalia massiliensis TaxID=2058294 RepID=UPI000F53F9BF|nr:glycosyltransferase family 4 protein [Vaginisenegalia massiliensis]
MKVLLYSEQLDKISKSGLGKSINHQMRALELAGIDYTLNSQDDFDVLHINTYFYESMAFARKCRKDGKAIVYHAHSTEEDFRNSFLFSNQLSPLFKQWLLSCYRLGDILITPTPYAKKILETYPLDREIVPISNGIDLNKFTPIPHARQLIEQKYGYQASDFIVMGIGLYLERKGILDFVELAKRMPHIQFIWFGFTNLNLVPNKIREAVETQLPNLRFAGYVENKEIITALQGTDLYIFTTYEETEGIPAVEACAAKADFIVRDIPVFGEWLEHEANVYKAKDIDAFQDYIQAFKDGQLPSLTDAAYEVAENRDLPAIGHQLRDVYERALKLAQQRQQSNSKF